MPSKAKMEEPMVNVYWAGLNSTTLLWMPRLARLEMS